MAAVLAFALLGGLLYWLYSKETETVSHEEIDAAKAPAPEPDSHPFSMPPKPLAPHLIARHGKGH